MRPQGLINSTRPAVRNEACRERYAGGLTLPPAWSMIGLGAHYSNNATHRHAYGNRH